MLVKMTRNTIRSKNGKCESRIHDRMKKACTNFKNEFKKEPRNKKVTIGIIGSEEK